MSTTTMTPPPRTTTDGVAGTAAGLVLAVACLCQLMVVLDVSVVNLALPSIRGDLGFSADSLPWVINAYTLTFGGLLLLGGRIADLFGHRRAALIGLGLFGLTSLLGGFAQTPAELIAARALQGVGGALLLPISLTLITVTFPEGVARHRALAIWGAVAGAGGGIGVFLGGLLTEALDWRWVLFVNVPIAIGAMGLTWRAVTDRRTGRRPRLDLPGAVLVTAGLVSLVYAIVGTDRHPWGSAATLVPLGLAVVLLAAFGYYELRVAAAPLVRFALLRTRSVLGANVVIFLMASAQLAAFYFASLYLQETFGYSPLHAGLAFVPFSLGIIAGSALGGRFVARVGPRAPLVTGLALGGAGLAWFAGLSPGGMFLSDVLGPSLVTSVGFGMCFVSVATAATAGVARHEAGLASGLLNSSRQLGGSVGLAVLATVANAAGGHTSGTDRAFVVAAVLMAVAVVVAAVLLRPRQEATP